MPGFLRVLFALALLGWGGATMANRLANETSPYLLQHADNPVDWYPWGEAALAKARRENKPIFLSIGYATCHWCHVMERESFEDPEIARILNEHFVAVKVDREQRPDLDAQYMRAYQALTGHTGGWPLNLFLTPEGEPFYGGTYFPPERRGGWPSFHEVLLAVAGAWRSREGELRAQAGEVVGRLTRELAPADALPEDLHERALASLAVVYDEQAGGFGVAPKFPHAPLLRYLLLRSWLGEGEAAAMLRGALDGMARGGVFDHVGGGFHRYATDPHWRVPHFEKMLYDNAQLARVYLGAARVLGEPAFEEVARATLDWMLAEMQGPAGGFYSAIDADSGGEEGRYYVWTWDEWTAALGDDAERAARLFGVRPEGNWEAGKNILYLPRDPADRADDWLVEPQAFTAWLERVRSRLAAARGTRARPVTDDKVLADWNGLALAALAEAGRLLDEPRYLEAARAGSAFLWRELYADGMMRHGWRGGVRQSEAFLADQAAVALGFLELHHATGEVIWLERAAKLAEAMLRFRDLEGGFFDALTATPAGRPKDRFDGALPSGNALAAEALLRLGLVYENEAWYEAGLEVFEKPERGVAERPLAYGALLAAHLWSVAGAELAVVLPAEELEGYACARSWPLVTFVFGRRGAFPLLAERPEGRAYLCRRGVCRLPAETPEGLEAEKRALFPGQGGS